MLEDTHCSIQEEEGVIITIQQPFVGVSIVPAYGDLAYSMRQSYASSPVLLHR